MIFVIIFIAKSIFKVSIATLSFFTFLYIFYARIMHRISLYYFPFYSLFIVFMYYFISFSFPVIQIHVSTPFQILTQETVLNTILYCQSVCIFRFEVSHRQHIDGSHFLIHSVTLHVFFGEFNQSKFKVIIDRFIFIVILLFLFWLFL